MTDFFTKPEQAQPMPPEPATPQTVQVGDKQYTQEELNQLVNLGETAREYESKWNRPISNFYPDYTQKSQELADYKRREQEAQQAQLQAKSQEGQLTPEEARALAIQQAKELGIVTNDIFEDRIQQGIANAMAGQELINDSKALVSEATSKGLPSVELTDLLSYMNGENPTGTRFGTPEKAYNDMFEKEIGSWREQQLSSIKPQGMVTNNTPQAGNNTVPQPASLTKETLSQAIRESLTRNSGV